MEKTDEWAFHTYINPETIVNIQKLAFDCSFNIFLNEITQKIPMMLSDIEKIKSKTNRTRYRHYINITGDNNIIIHDHMEQYSFYKERFLLNKTFKNKLIEYFKPHDLFVKGPIMRRQGVWFIDLLWKSNTNNEHIN